MDDSLEKLMASKTDDELDDYLIDVKLYSANEVRCAMQELKKRCKYMNQLQTDYFQKVIQRKLAEESEDTPVYYPRQSIFIYSLLLPVIFGFIVFALNLKNQRDKLVVIGFGITYFAVGVSLGNMLNMPARIPVLFNFCGAAMIELFFWNKYIGKHVLYKERSMLTPVLIALAIVTSLSLLSFYLEGYLF